MNRIYVIISAIIITGAAIALHVDLDPAKKIEFAQKRMIMMNAKIKSKQAQVQNLEKALESLPKGTASAHELANLEAQLKQLHEDIVQLGQDVKITENSIKALISKK